MERFAMQLCSTTSNVQLQAALEFQQLTLTRSSPVWLGPRTWSLLNPSAVIFTCVTPLRPSSEWCPGPLTAPEIHTIKMHSSNLDKCLRFKSAV